MIKKLVLVLILCLSVGSFVGCTDDNVVTSEAPSQINSKSDLDAYLANEPGDSPLRAFAPAARERFLNALTFSEEGGVSGYYFGDEDKLSPDQARALLRLFNLQSDGTPGIKPVEGMDGYRCVARATCQYIGAGYVCLATC